MVILTDVTLLQRYTSLHFNIDCYGNFKGIRTNSSYQGIWVTKVRVLLRSYCIVKPPFNLITQTAQFLITNTVGSKQWNYLINLLYILTVFDSIYPKLSCDLCPTPPTLLSLGHNVRLLHPLAEHLSETTQSRFNSKLLLISLEWRWQQVIVRMM